MRCLPASLIAFLLTGLLLILPSWSVAAPYYGASASYAADTKEPPGLHGYQFSLNYDPQRFQWRKFNVYFDFAVSHFWLTTTPYYDNETIFSISPIIRYTFKQRGPISPFLELSIGASYLNHTHLDDRNMGIHFAFHDRMGFGVYFGNNQQFSLGIHSAHFSNAHLSANNSGITVPLFIDLGYRFS